jgi:hypothetical protein
MAILGIGIDKEDVIMKLIILHVDCVKELEEKYGLTKMKTLILPNVLR